MQHSRALSRLTGDFQVPTCGLQGQLDDPLHAAQVQELLHCVAEIHRERHLQQVLKGLPRELPTFCCRLHTLHRVQEVQGLTGAAVLLPEETWRPLSEHTHERPCSLTCSTTVGGQW